MPATPPGGPAGHSFAATRHPCEPGHSSTTPSPALPLQAKFVAAGWRRGADSLSDVVYADRRAMEDEGQRPVLEKEVFVPIARSIIENKLLHTQLAEEMNALELMRQRRSPSKVDAIRCEIMEINIEIYGLLIEGGEELLVDELRELADSDVDEGTVTKGNRTALLLLTTAIMNAPPRRKKLGKVPLEGKQQLGLEVRETAIIGVGPAAAEYIVSNRSTLNPRDTYIFGVGQPWDASTDAEETRHIAHNHDLAAVSANPNVTGLGDRRKTDQAVTQEINAILAPYWTGESWIKLNADGIEEDKKGYKIGTEAADFHAKNVVVALGTGVERVGRDYGEVKVAHEQSGAKTPSPVMKLNEFQRWLVKDEPEIAGERVIVSGGNAGVDAVFTATGRGARVVWYLGSTGSMLYVEGMANSKVDWKLVDAIIPARVTGSFDDESKRVRATGAIDGKKIGNLETWVTENARRLSEQDGGPPLNLAKGILNAGLEADGQPVPGYVLVYGTGADLTPVSKVLGEEKSNYAAYEPVYETGSGPGGKKQKEPKPEDATKINKAYGALCTAVILASKSWANAKLLSSEQWDRPIPQNKETLRTSWINGGWADGKEVKQEAAAAVVDLDKRQAVAYSKAHSRGGGGIKIIGSTARSVAATKGDVIDRIPESHVGQVVDSGQHTVVREAVRATSGVVPAFTGNAEANFTYGSKSEISAALAAAGLDSAHSAVIVAAVVHERTLAHFINPKAENNAQLFQRRWEAIVAKMAP